MSAVEGDERQDLEQRRQFLLESLRDLEREHEAGDITDDDYDSLRADYTARAAAVLRALEPATSRDAPSHAIDGGDAIDVGDSASSDEGAPQKTDGRQSRRNRRRPVATIAVIVLIAAAAGYGVWRWGGARVDGPSLTSGTPAERLVRAHQRDTAGKAGDAIRLYDSVLEVEPANVEALTYKGWLLARAGLGKEALESLDRAIAIAPEYPDPHFFRGVVIYRDQGDPAAAIPEFETFLARNPPPDAVAAVQSVLDQARQDLAQKTSSPSTAPGPETPPVPG
ncbi:MAG TPA: tetratricopeptide repeat protein [Acidimicrobiales bacterium]|nr:tetratricopeptide repeat protein [Acidimicrobiales bacterium]